MLETIKKYFAGVAKRKKMGVFMVFVLFSFFMWFLIKLSEDYTYKVTFKVNYKNIPEDKLLLNTPRSTIDAIVSATGFKIFNYNIFKRSINIDLSAYDNPGKGFYILESDLEDEIENQYSDLPLRRVLSDTIYIQFGVNKEKYVKIVPDLNLSFESDYELYDDVKVVPDSMWILGPENIVDSIDVLKTVAYVGNNINDNIKTTLAIALPENSDRLNFQTKNVNVSAQVEKFSEKIVQRPVIVKNVPDSLSVRTFPTAVNILVRTALKDLKKITPEDFEVVCNYETPTEGNKLKLKIDQAPNIVGEVKLQIEEVEFLVKKK